MTTIPVTFPRIRPRDLEKLAKAAKADLAVLVKTYSDNPHAIMVHVCTLWSIAFAHCQGRDPDRLSILEGELNIMRGGTRETLEAWDAEQKELGR